MSLIILKLTRRSQRRQEKFIDIFPLPEIQANTREYFEQYSGSMIKILKQLFYYSRRNHIFRISQQWLATTCGITREWANKLLAQLETEGIIKMWFRFKEKSYYRISSFFTDKVIASIAYLWRGFSLNLLVSKPAPDAAQCNSSHLLYNVNYINNQLTSSTSLSRSEKDARARKDLTGLTGFIQKEREKMVEEKILPISNNLKSIRLTNWGEIRLSCYPDEAILYADEQMLKLVKPVSDRFKYFKGICENWCKEKEIPVAWSYMFKLAREHAMPDQGPFIDVSFQPVKLINQFDNRSVRDFQKREGETKHIMSTIERLKADIAKKKSMQDIMDKAKQKQYSKEELLQMLEEASEKIIKYPTQSYLWQAAYDGIERELRKY